MKNLLTAACWFCLMVVKILDDREMKPLWLILWSPDYLVRCTADLRSPLTCQMGQNDSNTLRVYCSLALLPFKVRPHCNQSDLTLTKSVLFLNRSRFYKRNQTSRLVGWRPVHWKSPLTFVTRLLSCPHSFTKWHHIRSHWGQQWWAHIYWKKGGRKMNSNSLSVFYVFLLLSRIPDFFPYN